MKYTRNQFSKLFGISTESLRYLEKCQIIEVERNNENGYMEYSDQQIPMIYSIKAFQAAGIPLEMIVPLCQDEKVPDHAKFLEQCIEELEKRKQNIEASISYLNFIHHTYCQELKFTDHLTLRNEERWDYLCFDDTGKNSTLIRNCIDYLPHLSLMIVVNKNNLEMEQLPVKLGINLPLHIEPCKPLAELVKGSSLLCQGKPGLYLYKVLFKQNGLSLSHKDIADMLSYASEHHYHIMQDLFGVLMGPENVKGKKGFYIRLFLLLEEA